MSTNTRTGPLEDLTIVDCTMAYAGPYGTALLADMGANVIKVEPPAGDNFRQLAPFPEDADRVGVETPGADYGAAFASVNRNKRSISLDLKDPNDREILLQLCEKADAIVENMRAGVMDELGVGYEVISARNPKIVYGTVRGYGDPRTGESPYADWPCLDVVGQSVGGLVEATGDLFGLAIADIFPGTLMATGLLAAVMQSRRTGKGEFFDVAMYDAVQALIKSNIASYGVTGKQVKPGRKGLVPFGLFPTSDGRISIAAPVERHWAFLCQAMGRPELISDDRTRSNPRRAKNVEFTEAVITAWTQTKTKQEVVSAIGGNVPCGPSNTIPEVLADPHTQARGMIQEFDFPGGQHKGLSTGSPIKFMSGDTDLYQRPPKHGEHGEEILAEFGIKARK
ncbi:CaiB/BaiF CoA-transferase family protein [Pseudomonadales bacterium]|nr:CaiB/BaiF CoA-transferase family protein [Pseudomonadales bacterium]